MNATTVEIGPRLHRSYAAAGPSGEACCSHFDSRRNRYQPMGKCNCRRWGDVVDVSQALVATATSTQILVMRGRLERWVASAAALALLAVVVLALWPVPNKYPFVLPGAVLAVVAFCAYRARFHADHDTPYLLAIVLLVGFAAMTLLHLGLPVHVVAVVGAVVAALLIAWFLMALTASGSADWPYDD